MLSGLRIVFFGTPKFAAHSLQKMIDAGYNVVAVVTATDKPAGRGQQIMESDVKKTALRAGITLLQPPNLKDPAFIEALAILQPDVGVVIAFRMLPEAVWALPRMGTFNLHASLLPQYRGAAPIQHAIINGETETGVTTFFLKHAIDTGDILLQQKAPILPEDDAGTLHDKLMYIGADLVLRTLELVKGGEWQSTAQNTNQTLYAAPKIHPDFCVLHNTMDIQAALNHIRGLSPHPGAWLPDKSMKVYKAAFFSSEQQNNTGLECNFSQKKLLWHLENGVLDLLEVQPAGKKRMDAQEYLNGQANKKN